MIDNKYPGKAFYKVGKTLLNSSRTLMKCISCTTRDFSTRLSASGKSLVCVVAVLAGTSIKLCFIYHIT